MTQFNNCCCFCCLYSSWHLGEEILSIKQTILSTQCLHWYAVCTITSVTYRQLCLCRVLQTHSRMYSTFTAVSRKLQWRISKLFTAVMVRQFRHYISSYRTGRAKKCAVFWKFVTQNVQFFVWRKTAFWMLPNITLLAEVKRNSSTLKITITFGTDAGMQFVLSRLSHLLYMFSQSTLIKNTCRGRR